ncbi:carbon-nitrogen hydrolase family protein [Proteiniborus sp. MB09-C3]|uniref:carbon-nitrogen hydrolase family protein n=1 Tax=Proteiniborus sp. MB09-C3 TaxID=3050072 RepID=UPI0025571702|nr:carbon-nitrogen hydrolase family protein [Proteiniborus sp. MB09-C3]WIV11526.1 carbon-nitrogen hydrolase family protein [Proteiniborus sp. MB09-C3]
MKIGLVSEVFQDGNIGYNFNQIKKQLIKCSEKKFDLICFGESFLQGFEGLSWEYHQDLLKACSQNDEIISSLRGLAIRHKIALSFGYIEREEDIIYSSNIVISDSGEILDNYRRISPGWKEPIADLRYYKEGNGFSLFNYKGKRFATAICGDLWDDEHIDSIKELKADCVLWPLYVDYSIDKWENGEREEYAHQVKEIQAPVLMINSYVEDESRAKGGCCVFQNGHVLKELPMGSLGVLEYEV